MQVLKFARDLALEDLHIEEVGCLGELRVEPACFDAEAGSFQIRDLPGSEPQLLPSTVFSNLSCVEIGPVMALIETPSASEGCGCPPFTGGCGSGPNMVLMPGEVPLRHISTPAKVTDVLRRLCALKVPDSLLKVV